MPLDQAVTARAGLCHAVLPLGSIADAVARIAMGMPL